LSAEDEDGKTIAQANAEYDDKGNFITPKVKARYEGDFPVIEPEKLDLMDIATNQITCIAASLIPYLEHDVATRALMGSNMPLQAVAWLRPEAPVVGTGLEGRVARDSPTLINAEAKGVVEYVDANEIKSRYERTDDDRLVSVDDDVKTYRL